MQSNQTPTLVPLAWAANGTKNTIPEASQITITPGAASLNDGFPPICAIKVAAGGIAPAYGDFNGAFNLITQSIRWAHGGGRYAFSSTFAADANVSGYPAGAMLMSADTLGSWISLDDANTDDPDTGAGTKWVPGHQYGVTPITGLTNANVTLTPAQAAKSKITLAGTLTGNVQMIFPAWTKEWEVVNNTTGAFTITAKTAAGSGVVLAAGQQKITGDGTNITQPAESIAPGTQSQHAVQLGQVAGVVGSARNLVMSVTAASASATMTADEIVVETALGGLRYCLASFSKTINLGTTGAGGMDTGTAPVSGFVALYAIYNPTTGASALLAQNASTLRANVYSGANMPSGYTASALVGVWPTNASSQFISAIQLGREIQFLGIGVLSSSTTASSFTSLPISAVVPANARTCSGNLSAVNNTASAGVNAAVASNVNGVGASSFSVSTPTANSGIVSPFSDVALITPQTLYYTNSPVGSGVSTINMSVNKYTI